MDSGHSAGILTLSDNVIQKELKPTNGKTNWEYFNI